jgi:hypothetical protein
METSHTPTSDFQATSETTYPESRAKRIFGGSTAEGLIGGCAVALAIIGLSNIFPMLLVCIASIVVGVAVAFEGGALSARHNTLLSEGRITDKHSRSWGVTYIFFAGAAGIALGILSLLNVVPMVLIAVSAIVLGSALMVDSGANEHLRELESSQATQATTGVQLMVGIGTVALGILALAGVAPLSLTLVAMLAIGAVNFVTGATISRRMAKIFK